MTRDELIAWTAERYSAEPEYPWDDEAFIFRHRSNRKWFAVVMRVGYRRLGLDREGTADVVNLKCGPLLMGAYRGLPGVLRCYHMNKEHWVSVLLDGSAGEDTVKELLELSYELTDRKTRPKKPRY